MTQRKVVIIEDDVLIASSIEARLRSEGFTVHIAPDGPSGLALCQLERPDIVVLDLMLPGLDGVEVCRRLQAEHATPVLMLTARDDEADMLVGLAVGADDYMTKPFSPRELVARIHTILRRVDRVDRVQPNETIAVGTLHIDVSRRLVQRDETYVQLTATEFDLLHLLAAKRGAVLSREQLLRNVWGYHDSAGARTVDSHIRSLRRKLGDDTIRTAHGVGYAIGEAIQ